MPFGSWEDRAAWEERAEELEEEVYALYLAVRDPRTPLAAKATIALVVVYVVSPIDPIPDLLPVLGYLDELVVLAGGAAIATRLVPDEVVEDARACAGDEIDAGRTRWIAAGLVLLAWILIGAVVLRAVTGWV